MPNSGLVLPTLGLSTRRIVQVDPDKCDEVRWKELQDIEKTRRAILTWSEDPFWQILTRYHGTVVPVLLSDSLLYITMAIYVSVRILLVFGNGLPASLVELGQGQISVVGGFIR